MGRGDGEEVCDAAVAPAARDLENLTRFDTKSARRATRGAGRIGLKALAVSHQWPVENLVRASSVITRAASSPARTMATAADRFNINSQLEHLQTRYVGTGHADTNRFEWAVNIHRDSYASYFGRHSMLQYFALAENESIGRVRYNMMQVRERERPPPASVA